MGAPEILADIRERMAKVETAQENTNNAICNLTNSIDRLVTKMDQSDDIARNADQRARSAHHRIDELQDNEIKALQDDQRWLWRTVVGALLTGAVALLWKGVGG